MKSLFSLFRRRPRTSTLFPYTTLFRSVEQPTLVTLTDSAASKIRDLMAEEPDGEAAVLRIAVQGGGCSRSEEHTSELQSHSDIVCRLLLEKQNCSATSRTLWPPRHTTS